MKQHIIQLLSVALDTLLSTNKMLSTADDFDIHIENTKNKDHGDFACNIAMVLAKTLKQNPRQIATTITSLIPTSELIIKTEIAGPGFINFFVVPQSKTAVIQQILDEKDKFGWQIQETPKSILIEYVSANPTGPLHVGHGRGAAFGNSLSNLLKTIGHQVKQEYYVNDAGRQMDILAVSVWLRYLSLENINCEFPDSGYQGDYIWDIATELRHAHSDAFTIKSDVLFKGLCADEKHGGDKEMHIDQLIEKAKTYLGNNYRVIFDYVANTITENIRQDLATFGVHYDQWFAEKSLAQDTKKTIAILEKNKTIYQKNGGKWFKSTDYGDEKDRVVVRSNNQTTYFASDIAYHQNKAKRGFDKLINIWGADHHGYIKRVEAGMSALGIDADRLVILLVQFAKLYRSGNPVQMSTRSGSFVTLAELYNEVGVDAARFFYVARKTEQHLDFDLDLAKEQNTNNPVFYIQYAHARIYRVLEKLIQNKTPWNLSSLSIGLSHLNLLDSSQDLALIDKLNLYQEVLRQAAQKHAPHQIATYLQELANDFHALYNSHKLIIDDACLRNARLALIVATGQVIKNGLAILGVSAPEKM